MSVSGPTPLTYASSGVDIDAGEEAVRRIKRMVESTHGPEVPSGIGGFGGLFAPGLTGLVEPVLVSGTDSVGSKLKLAFAGGRHNTVGIDAVAMCVNDIICSGARPLFFLDYIGIGRLEPGVVEQIVEGVVEGCRRARCALLGGEMAELPSIYAEGEYDLVGFAVGLADRPRLVTGEAAQPGDALIGLASSGLHSNGYSLSRHVVLDVAGLALDDELPGTGRSVLDELLEPTAIYVPEVTALLEAVPVHGLANITGGGLAGNVHRALRDGLVARIEGGLWPVPPVFRFIAEAGPVDRSEMLRTFNMGVGMVVVTAAERADEAIVALAGVGRAAWRIGTVAAHDGPAATVAEGEC